MPRTLDVLTLGETLVCLTSRGRSLTSSRLLTKSIGGTESNTAIGLARLGHRVAWISRVGTDPFGDEIVRTLRGEGVDVGAVGRSSDAPTGLMFKEVRTPSEIRVHYYRHGSAASGLSRDDVPLRHVHAARWLHVSGITLALGEGPAAALEHAVSEAVQHGVGVSFDPNYRQRLWHPEEAIVAYERVFPLVSDLLISEQELLTCAGASDLDAATKYLEQFEIPRVAIRRSADGVIGVHEGRRVEVSAAPVGHVVDTVGAGDAFNAGYLHGMLDDDPFATALATGNWVASRVVSHPGDYEGLPSIDELLDHQAGNGPVLR